MKAETMIEKLSGIVSHLHGFARPDKDECLRRLVEVITALRAQSKAEPVVWTSREAIENTRRIEIGAVRFPNRGYERSDFPVPLYLAPPPDHAEALAEDVERALGQYDDDAADDPDYVNPADTVERIRAALNRYKETRNG